MGFIPMRLKPESGANRIKSADDAYSFMMYMGLSYRNKPHWQIARQALNHASASDPGEIQAWRTLRAAADVEGWLAEYVKSLKTRVTPVQLLFEEEVKEDAHFRQAVAS